MDMINEENKPIVIVTYSAISVGLIASAGAAFILAFFNFNITIPSAILAISFFGIVIILNKYEVKFYSDRLLYTSFRKIKSKTIFYKNITEVQIKKLYITGGGIQVYIKYRENDAITTLNFSKDKLIGNRNLEDFLIERGIHVVYL